MAYEMDNPNELDEWVTMLRDFYPDHFSLACRAFRNQLPYGLPDWLVDSTVASFFNMFATEEAYSMFKDMKEESVKDPFKLGTVEEINFRTHKSKPWISGYPKYNKYLN